MLAVIPNIAGRDTLSLGDYWWIQDRDRPRNSWSLLRYSLIDGVWSDDYVWILHNEAIALAYIELYIGLSSKISWLHVCTTNQLGIRKGHYRVGCRFISIVVFHIINLIISNIFKINVDVRRFLFEHRWSLRCHFLLSLHRGERKHLDSLDDLAVAIPHESYQKSLR